MEGSGLLWMVDGGLPCPKLKQLFNECLPELPGWRLKGKRGRDRREEKGTLLHSLDTK